MIEYYKNLSLEPIVYINKLGNECVEEWRDIPNYIGYYQASILGRIKSLDRIVRHGYGGDKRLKGAIMAQPISADKYLGVRLTKKGVGNSFLTHVLVAMAFLNHVPCGHLRLVDHRDNDDFLNNTLWNIQIITARENVSKDRKKGSSKYRGVFYRVAYSHWRSCIKIGKNTIEIGAFKIEEDAAKAYLIAVENLDKFDGDNAKFRELVKSIMRSLSDS